MSREPITALVADDHPVYRNGPASRLDPLPDIASRAVVAARETGPGRAVGSLR